MKFFYHLISLAVLLHSAISGRNDGEPDYDPDDLMMNMRDDGRNDGEPDYDGSNDFVHEHPYRMLIPDKFRGMMCKFLMHLVRRILQIMNNFTTYLSLFLRLHLRRDMQRL